MSNRIFLLLSNVLFLCANISFAQKDLVPKDFRDFSGGLNTNTDALFLQDNESPNTQNVVIDEPLGSLLPRNGILLCGNLPSGNAPKTLFEYFQGSGNRALIVSDNETYYETRNCKAFTQIITGLSDTALGTYAIVRDKLWVANGSTHVFTWNGTTSNLLDGRANTPNPAPPNCSYLEFWRERVWCARTKSNPSQIAFSALVDSSGVDIDPSTGTLAWPVVNAINIDQDGGSPIYGIRSYRDNLYVFKNNGIWRVLFRSEFDLEVIKTMSSVGSRFQQSITEIDGLLYFVGPDGMYVFDGDQSVRISDRIVGTFESFKQPLSNESFNLWTNEDDFNAGTLEASLLVQPLQFTISNSSFTDTDQSDFDQFTSTNLVTTVQSSGAILSVRIGLENSTFEEGDLSGWTTTGGTGNDFQYLSNGFDDSNASGCLFGGESDTPNINVVVSTSGVELCTSTFTASASWQDFTCSAATIEAGAVAGDTLTIRATGTNPSASNCLGTSIEQDFIWHSSGVVAKAWKTTANRRILFDRIVANQYAPVTFFESRSFNTELSSPTYGNLLATFTVLSNSSVTFQTATSDDDSTFDAFISVSTGHPITSTSRQYIKYKTIFSCSGECQNTNKVDIVTLLTESTGILTSDVFDTVTVSSWGAFETTQELSGGSINWEIRTGSDTDSISARAFLSITPGDSIPATSTDTNVQWRATLSGAGEAIDMPTVQDVTINFSQGEAVNTPIYGASHKNRYWISAATTATTNDIVVVKTKNPTNSWVPYDLKIGPMARFNDNFYGGASTHSAIYRLDFGSNDDGVPIVWFWEWKDEIWQAPYNKKQLIEINVDFRKDNASNTKIGFSDDNGANFTDFTVDMSGSGRGISILRPNADSSHDYRLRILNNTVDESATILGIAGWTRVYKARTE